MTMKTRRELGLGLETGGFPPTLLQGSRPSVSAEFWEVVSSCRREPVLFPQEEVAKRHSSSLSLKQSDAPYYSKGCL